MTVAATAPGKLVVLGEYAVLDGAPALVVATRERAEARLAPLEAGPSRARARPVWPDPAAFDWARDGRVHWHDPAAAAALEWLGRLLAGLRGTGDWPGGPYEVVTDTRAFHRRDGGKLGLGASAALAVALARAGAAAAGRPAQGPAADLARLVELHAAAQGGGGSGLDVAAALYGGTIRFRRGGDGPRAEPVAWPPGLHLLAVITPASVATPAYLDRLRAWARARPDRWAEQCARLAAIAEAGAAAAEPAALADAVAAYGDGLDALERAAGLEIFGAAHRRAAELAQGCGVAYKPSGAGGDCGLAVATDPGRLTRFRAGIERLGLAALELAPAAGGAAVSDRAAAEC